MTLCGQTNAQLPHWIQCPDPTRDKLGDVAFFPLAGAAGVGAVDRQFAHTGRASPWPGHHLGGDGRARMIGAVSRNSVGRSRSDFRAAEQSSAPRAGAARVRPPPRSCAADHLGLPLLAVGFFDRGLDPRDRLHPRAARPSQREEAGLHDGVDAPPMPVRCGPPGRRRRHVQAQPLVDDLLLQPAGAGVPQLVGRIGAR
jgi:hypothetical protein